MLSAISPTDAAAGPWSTISRSATFLIATRNSGGLQFVNVADPTSPRLLRTVNVTASQVEVVNGIAYATVGTTLQAFDLLTGENRQTLPLSGSTLFPMRPGFRSWKCSPMGSAAFAT